ncbi:MAG TPA: adenosylcobinamide-phosphate synthase CbiB [Desulfobacteria bacterium]|nr:adenosylcobinamide-phosphate synthase CbiB [Desulfobacteria bacterium]
MLLGLSKLGFDPLLLSIWLILWAFVLDLLVGDPRKVPHPVTLIGMFIAWFEAVTNKGGQLRRRISGIVLVVLTVSGTYLLTWGLVVILTRINSWLGLLAYLWLLATTLASKSLAQAGQEIYRELASNNLPLARRRLGFIVGRDTADLSREEVVRATVETVAENIVDGITAPLFFAMLGGLPLAMAYKAINTLDSMVGYKNDRYKDYGWAGARLDDVANFIPSRVTGLILTLAARFHGLDWRSAFATMQIDAPKHPSPNSGYSEAAVAGALGVRLGGLNSYGGVKSQRAYMGETKHALAPGQILATVKLAFTTGWLFLILGSLLKVLAWLIWR